MKGSNEFGDLGLSRTLLGFGVTLGDSKDLLLVNHVVLLRLKVAGCKGCCGLWGGRGPSHSLWFSKEGSSFGSSHTKPAGLIPSSLNEAL